MRYKLKSNQMKKAIYTPVKSNINQKERKTNGPNYKGPLKDINNVH